MEYKGHRFEPDQDVYLLVGAANRDGAQFTQPDTLDITRDSNQHLSFSGGIHADDSRDNTVRAAGN